MKSDVTVIGDGAMAAVSCKILSGNGLRVCMWSAFEDHAQQIRLTRRSRFLPELELDPAIRVTTDPVEAFASAQMAVSAVPAQYARAVWEKLKAHCPAALPICSVTKGIENGTLLRPSQVLADVLAGAPDGPWPLVALSGPCIAHEVARGLPATAVAACADAALARRVQKAYTAPYFRVYTNADVIGVELAGATKNVIAIAAGVLDGLQAGDNAKAALLTRGLVEITRLGLALGGRAETFSGLAGLGDLVTTCVSPHGRNRTLGQAIGQGQNLQQAQAAIQGVVEGVATTKSVLELARSKGVEMPIAQAVGDVLFANLSPRKAIFELMSRPPKSEI